MNLKRIVASGLAGAVSALVFSTGALAKPPVFDGATAAKPRPVILPISPSVAVPRDIQIHQIAPAK